MTAVINNVAMRDEEKTREQLIAELNELRQRLVQASAAEAQLRAVEARFRVLTEGAYDLICETDLTGHFIYLSPNYRQILGYDPEELLGTNAFTLVHPDDTPGIKGHWGDPSLSVEFRGKHKNGEWRWFEGHGRLFDAGHGEQRYIGISRDITARKRVEAELRAVESRFRLLSESAYDLICETDIESKILYVSPNHKELTGYAPEELIGRNALDGVHPDDIAGIVAQRDVESTHVYFRYWHKNGEWRWFEGTGKVFDAGNGVLHHLGISRDITESKRAEERLKEQHSLLEAVIEGTTDAVYVKDLKGRYLMINRAGAQFLGKRVEEVLGKDDLQLFSPETAQPIMERDRAVSREGKTCTFEDVGTAAGVTRTYYTTKGPYRDYQGNIIGVLGISRDITERKRDEEALATEKERLAVTLRSIADGVITTDTEGRVVLINKAAEDMIGISQEEAAGQPLTKIFHIYNESSRKTRRNPVDKALKTGKIVNFANHTVLISRDKVERFIADSAAPIKDRDNNIIGAVLVFRDITAQRKIEEKLLHEQAARAAAKLARAELEKSNRQLQALSAHVLKAQEEERIRLARELHDELGQSLTSIRLALELAITNLSSAGPDKTARILNDLSTYIDATSKEVQRVARDLRPSILDDFGLAVALESYCDAFSKRTGIKVNLSVSLCIMPLAKEVETAFFRIVQEALTNSAKHSQAQHIFIDLSDESGKVSLSVSDDGHGCVVERHKDSYRGFGLLGMAERARMVGARLSIRSQPGRGFLLQVSLPTEVRD